MIAIAVISFLAIVGSWVILPGSNSTVEEAYSVPITQVQPSDVSS